MLKDAFDLPLRWGWSYFPERRRAEVVLYSQSASLYESRKVLTKVTEIVRNSDLLATVQAWDISPPKLKRAEKEITAPKESSRV